VCTLAAPIFGRDFGEHATLRGAPFMFLNENTKEYEFLPDVALTSYWHYVRGLIVARNPGVAKSLDRFST
jgi:hypothetical protein